MEIRNAQVATEIRARLLDAVQASLREDTSTAAALERIETNILKLLKDSEDRGLGTPQASVDVSNKDGSLQRAPIQELVIAALTKIHDGKIQS